MPPEVTLNDQAMKKYEEEWERILSIPLPDSDDEFEDVVKESKISTRVDSAQSRSALSVLQRSDSKRLIEAIQPVLEGKRGKSSG